MTAILALGFVIGMRHALEADHLAAVAALATRARNLPAALRQGLLWGIGHTLALFAVAGSASLLGLRIDAQAAAVLELAVGLMLVVLALDVAWRLRLPGPTARSRPSDLDPNRVPGRLKARAMLVGSLHGMAGSAALVLLTVQTVRSPWLGLAYIGLFGLGSIAGMGVLSAALAAPFCLSAHRLGRVYVCLSGVAAATSLVVGALVIHRSAAILL